MKVFLHTRSYGKVNWTNVGREFGRLPVVGEYVALEDDSQQTLYRVLVVVHCPIEDAEYQAEVFAVKINPDDMHKQTLSDAYIFR